MGEILVGMKIENNKSVSTNYIEDEWSNTNSFSPMVYLRHPRNNNHL